MVVIVVVTANQPQGPDRGNGVLIKTAGNSPSIETGSISTSTSAPTTTKFNKLRRDSGLFIDNDVDSLPTAIEGPPQIESVLHSYFFFLISQSTTNGFMTQFKTSQIYIYF